jgi:diadenylate cyclase
MNLWLKLIEQFQLSGHAATETARLFWQGIANQISLLGLVDVALVFGLLWWIYRKLRQTDLIKIFPRILWLLVIVLVARMLGLLALFYVAGFLLVIVLLAIGALYAPEIKRVLETPAELPKDTAKNRFSTGDLQSMVQAVGEAMAVLTRSHQPALIMIRTDKPVTRLIETGTKMNAQVRSELLIDFFASGSNLSRGAVIIEGNRIVAAGSTLLRPNAKVLFSATNATIQKVAKEFHVIVIISNKTIGDVSLVYRDDYYKHLSPRDLTRVLQTILV